MSAANGRSGECRDHLFRHLGGHFGKGVRIAQLDLPDLLGLDSRFAGNGSYEVSLLGAVTLADVDEELRKRGAHRSYPFGRRLDHGRFGRLGRALGSRPFALDFEQAKRGRRHFNGVVLGQQRLDGERFAMQGATAQHSAQFVAQ